jgi:hypothetical protein
MSWLKRLLGMETSKPRTMLDDVREASAKIIVSRYRQLGRDSGQAPTAATSDEEIVSIYSKVITAFREAGKQRGEHVRAENLNAIVWQFLIMKEMVGNEFMNEHLDYEIAKYLREGLRPDYLERELSLF